MIEGAPAVLRESAEPASEVTAAVSNEAAPPRSKTTLSELAPSQRTVALDVLRGLALCGVMLGNMSWFSGRFDPTLKLEPTLLDSFAGRFLQVCVYGKAASTMGLLFGLGFAMQLIRAEERGESVTGLYLRRLGALGLFGVLHMLLLWWGDVTWTYAIAGVALLAFVRVSNRARVIWAVCLMLVPHLIASIPAVSDAAVGVFLEPDERKAGFGRLLAAIHAPDRGGLWWEHLRFAGVFMAGAYLWYFFWVLGRFLLGYIAGKQRWFARDGADHLPMFRRLAAWGGVVALVINAIVFAIQHKWLPLDALGVAGRLVGTVLFELGMLSTVLFYVGIVVLAMQRPRLRRLLAVLAPAGRMPLTTYFTQSLVCTFLFYGWGLGWGGKVGAAATVGIALVIFSVQVVIAQLWLRCFRLGPFEWLWRAAVYWKLPQMRNAPAAPL
jgi:uncharacterized protein